MGNMPASGFYQAMNGYGESLVSGHHAAERFGDGKPHGLVQLQRGLVPLEHLNMQRAASMRQEIGDQLPANPLAGMGWIHIQPRQFLLTGDCESEFRLLRGE